MAVPTRSALALRRMQGPGSAPVARLDESGQPVFRGAIAEEFPQPSRARNKGPNSRARLRETGATGLVRSRRVLAWHRTRTLSKLSLGTSSGWPERNVEEAGASRLLCLTKARARISCMLGLQEGRRAR